MEFSGKICLLILLKVTKNQGFTFSVQHTFFEKPRGQGQIDSQPFQGKVRYILILYCYCHYYYRSMADVIIMLLLLLLPVYFRNPYCKLIINILRNILIHYITELQYYRIIMLLSYSSIMLYISHYITCSNPWSRF